jgi:hypothetical protein
MVDERAGSTLSTQHFAAELYGRVRAHNLFAIATILTKQPAHERHVTWFASCGQDRFVS